MSRPTIIFFAFLLVSFSNKQDKSVPTDIVVGQTNYSQEIEDRIKQVEQNIGFIKFQIEGQPNDYFGDSDPSVSVEVDPPLFHQLKNNKSGFKVKQISGYFFS
jgi:FKBP-type peptidyl-prolyl cis-trans isomerase 2